MNRRAALVTDYERRPFVQSPRNHTRVVSKLARLSDARDETAWSLSNTRRAHAGNPAGRCSET